MAAGVEQAVVVCPFLTPAYQASRSCKKELSYADTREVAIVPVMLAHNWEPSEWLGLVTAGLLNAATDEERLELCLQALQSELMFTVGDLITAEQPEEEAPERAREVNKKPARAFCHALTALYICDTADPLPESNLERTTMELSDLTASHCHWEELKGLGCKFYRNVHTKRYISFDPIAEQVLSVCGQSEEDEWLLLVDQSDQSPRRAVIIKNKNSGRFLAVKGRGLVGLESYTDECKWFLD
uniref:Uncharacterized protein n=1 Tax=Knipowitschia caucasica TaxID=637954 RepID=A0AAV2LKT5_KNICA